jgi:hypothetical protein
MEMHEDARLDLPGDGVPGLADGDVQDVPSLVVTVNPDLLT